MSHQARERQREREKELTLRVDGASNAVVDLVVQLGEHVLGVDGGVRHVSDGSSLDDVGDLVPLDGLVLRDEEREGGGVSRRF